MMAKSKARLVESEDAEGAEDGGIATAEASSERPVNKSEAIRVEGRAVLDAGGQPRPSEIVRSLAARGIDVAPAMVSTVLKRMGVQRRARRPSAASARQPAPTREAPARRESAASAESFTVDQLITAKKFVETVGSPKRAMALLDALDRLM